MKKSTELKLRKLVERIIREDFPPAARGIKFTSIAYYGYNDALKDLRKRVIAKKEKDSYYWLPRESSMKFKDLFDKDLLTDSIVKQFGDRIYRHIKSEDVYTLSKNVINTLLSSNLPATDKNLVKILIDEYNKMNV